MNISSRALLVALFVAGLSADSLAQDAPRSGYLGFMLDDRPWRIHGVPVMRVHPRTPAEAAGFQVGDIVVSCNGSPIRDVGDFARAIYQVPAGERAVIEVRRGGELFELTAILSAGPDAPLVDSRTPISPDVSTNRVPYDRPILGLVVGTVQTRSYGLFGSLRQWGVIVEDVVPGSPAEQHRVPRGAILTAINGLTIRTPDDVFAIMEQVLPDQPVELSYVIGGSAYRQIISRAIVDASSDPDSAPRGVAKPLEEGVVIEPPPEPVPPTAARDDLLPELPPPAPRPEDDVRLPTPKSLSPDEVRAMRDELTELRRRAAAIQAELDAIKREAEPD